MTRLFLGVMRLICRRRGAVPSDVGHVPRLLESIAEFSCLRLLRCCSIQHLGRLADNVVKTSKIIGNPNPASVLTEMLVRIMIQLCMGLLGLLAVMVKVAQLDFIPTTLYLDFTLGQVIRAISFATNVTSVYDIGDERKAAVRRFLVQNYEHALCDCQGPSPIIKAWERKLAHELWTRFGPRKACQRFDNNSDCYLLSRHARNACFCYGWKARAQVVR